jgi:DNA-binding protein Fis
MISVYSLPAAIALLIKLLVLYFSWRTEVRDAKTQLFFWATIASLGISVVETVGVNLKSLLAPEAVLEYSNLFGFSYYAFLIPFLGLLVILAVVISEEKRAFAISIFITIYVLILEYLLLFTSLLITDFQPLKYAISRVPGPLYGLFEFLTVVSALVALFFPLQGIKADRPPLVRSQCKLWLATASPVVLLIVLVFALLHFNIRLFNTVATLPLLSALLLVAVGYAVHNRRIIELDFYLPWSHTRKHKALLYSRLSAAAAECSAEQTIRNLADILKCPAVLISPHKSSAIEAGDGASALSGFPREELEKVDRMLVSNEGEDLPGVRHSMGARGVGVIIPFFPHSSTAASWLLLGDGFNAHIYTPLDFRTLQLLLDRLAILLLDDVLRPETSLQQKAAQLRDLQSSQESLQEQFQRLFLQEPAGFSKRPLEEYVSEFEAAIIKRALDYCEGNRSRAARLLGLRANTLHYKIERHGIGTAKKKSPPMQT